MGIRRLLAIASAALLVSGAMAAHPPEALKRAGAVLYASFDKAAEPEYAAGAPPFYKYLLRKPMPVTGKVGGAMSFHRLTLRVEGALDGDRGTVAFWFRGKLSKRQPICVIRSREWGYYHLQVRWEGTGASHGVRYYDLFGRQRGSAAGKVKNPLQWRHCAFTWDHTEGVAFYVDGKRTREQKSAWWASASPSAMELHAGREGAYDELYGFDRALTAGEIRGLAAGKLPSASGAPLTEARRKAALRESGLDDPANEFIEVGRGPVLVKQVAIDRAKSGTITMPWPHDGRYHPYWPDVYTSQPVLDVWPKPGKFNYVTWEASQGKTELKTADGSPVAVGEGKSPQWVLRKTEPQEHKRLRFHRHGARLHELSLFHVSPAPASGTARSLALYPSSGAELDGHDDVWAPKDRRAFRMSDTAGKRPSESFDLDTFRTAHWVGPEVKEPFFAKGLTLQLRTKTPQSDLVLLVAVVDPGDPLRHLVKLPVRVIGKGGELRLDLRGFIIERGQRLHVTIRPTRDVTLVLSTPVVLEPGDPKQVTAEFMEDTWKVAHGLFGWCAERRPWRQYNKEKWICGRYGGYALAELDALVERILRWRPGDRRAYATWVEIHQKPRVKERITLDVPEGVPPWAVYGREVIRSLLRYAHWWHDNRLMPDGQLGGGWNDDPCLTGYLTLQAALGDAKALSVIQSVADGWVENSGHNKDGFNKRRMDYLHASDETAGRCNLLKLRYGSARNVLRSMETCRNLKVWLKPAPNGAVALGGHDVWSGNVAGSPWAGSYVFNVFSDPVAWAWYSGDPDVTRLMLRMADTYLDAAEKFWKQKPREFNLAVSINGKTGEWRGGGKNGQSGKEEFFFTAYVLSGFDRKYLRPGLRRRIHAGLAVRELPAPEQLKHFRGRALADSLIARKRETYSLHPVYESSFALAYLQTGKESYVTEGLRICLEELLWGAEYMNSAAEKPTDRVFPPPGSKLLGHMMCGGKPASDRTALFGSLRVTWDGIADDVVALVEKEGPKGMTIRAYCFADAPRTVGMRFWRLERGEYRVIVTPQNPKAGAATKNAGEIRRGTRVSVTLKPGLQRVSVEQTRALPPLPRQLPDVAVSAYFIKRDPDGTLRVPIYNIGSADTGPVEVGILVDGAKNRTMSVSNIPWPRDFHAKPAVMRIRAPDIRAVSVRVKLARGEEITTENNTAEKVFEQADQRAP